MQVGELPKHGSPESELLQIPELEAVAAHPDMSQVFEAGANPAECPYLNSLGAAGIELYEQMQQSRESEQHQPTIRELLEARKQNQAEPHTEPPAAASEPIVRQEAEGPTGQEQPVVRHDEVAPPQRMQADPAQEHLNPYHNAPEANRPARAALQPEPGDQAQPKPHVSEKVEESLAASKETNTHQEKDITPQTVEAEPGNGTVRPENINSAQMIPEAPAAPVPAIEADNIDLYEAAAPEEERSFSELDTRQSHTEPMTLQPDGISESQDDEHLPARKPTFVDRIKTRLAVPMEYTRAEAQDITLPPLAGDERFSYLPADTLQRAEVLLDSITRHINTSEDTQQPQPNNSVIEVLADETASQEAEILFTELCELLDIDPDDEVMHAYLIDIIVKRTQSIGKSAIEVTSDTRRQIRPEHKRGHGSGGGGAVHWQKRLVKKLGQAILSSLQHREATPAIS